MKYHRPYNVLNGDVEKAKGNGVHRDSEFFAHSHLLRKHITTTKGACNG